jgi:hypothetical protein
MTFRHRHSRQGSLIETVEVEGEKEQGIQRLRYNGVEKEVVCFSKGGKLHGRRMDERSSLAPRSLTEDPSGLLTGTGPGYY